MKRISRRNFLKVAGVGAAALGLAACGGSSSSTASSTASSAAASAAAAEDVTIKVAAIETGYGADMWKKVTEAFTAQTGIKVELTTDKKLEDVIGPSMQGGDYPDVIHLATGREAALTEQFIKGNLIADITDVLSMTVPGESSVSKRQKTGVPFQIKLMDIPMQIIGRYKAFRKGSHLFNIGNLDTTKTASANQRS